MKMCILLLLLLVIADAEFCVAEQGEDGVSPPFATTIRRGLRRKVKKVTRSQAKKIGGSKPNAATTGLQKPPKKKAEVQKNLSKKKKKNTSSKHLDFGIIPEDITDIYPSDGSDDVFSVSYSPSEASPSSSYHPSTHSTKAPSIAPSTRSSKAPSSIWQPSNTTTPAVSFDMRRDGDSAIVRRKPRRWLP